MDEYEDERACETAGREAKAGKGRPLKQTKVTDVFAGKKLRVRRAAGASADGAQGDKKRKADAPAPVQKASREEAPDDDGDASPRLNAGSHMGRTLALLPSRLPALRGVCACDWSTPGQKSSAGAAPLVRTRPRAAAYAPPAPDPGRISARV
jgi:hypothetical protein